MIRGKTLFLQVNNNKVIIKKMKKILSTIAFMMGIIPMFAQTNNGVQQVKYSVSGICPTNVQKVYLVDVAKRYARIDSAEVKDGKFSLAGSFDKDAFLGVGIEAYCLFINDGSNVSMDLTNYTLKGSALNMKLNVYDRHIDSLGNKAKEIIQPYLTAQASGKTQEELQALLPTIQQNLVPLESELNSYCKQIIKDNPDNIIPAAFFENVIYEYELSELKALLDPKYPYVNHPMMKGIKDYVAKEEAKQAIVGKQFIDIEENDVDGKPHKLSEYVGKGNYVLIDFWASWCGPCMTEMPNVKANYDKYHSKGFNVVGLSFDRNKESWVKAIKEKELNWTHLSDLKYWNTIAASTYGINAIPSSLLVDPSGKVIARDLRGAALGKKLAEIYGE